MKIDNTDTSRAFDAEDASEVTHCNCVLSKQIPASYLPARADHLSAGHSVIERNYDERDEADLSKGNDDSF